MLHRALIYGITTTVSSIVALFYLILIDSKTTNSSSVGIIDRVIALFYSTLIDSTEGGGITITINSVIALFDISTS